MFDFLDLQKLQNSLRTKKRQHHFFRDTKMLGAIITAMVIALIVLIYAIVINIYNGQVEKASIVTTAAIPSAIDSLPDEKPKPSLITLSQKDYGNFKYKDLDFTAFKYDCRQDQISFYLKDSTDLPFKTIKVLKEYLRKDSIQLRFATNAGIFKKDGMPEGLFVNAGIEISGLNSGKGKGNFYLEPNGVFFINQNGKLNITNSKVFAAIDAKPEYATQSGPLLLINGEVHPAFNKQSKNTFIRSGVGVISPYEAVFIISHTPINFYDFAMTFKDNFGCQQALYLDGAISEMYVPGQPELDLGNNFSGIIGVTTKK